MLTRAENGWPVSSDLGPAPGAGALGGDFFPTFQAVSRKR